MGAEVQKRPVRLELNNSGAWKVVSRFDAGDDHASSIVQESAYALAKLDPKSKWRISTEATPTLVLCYCQHDTGWVQA